MAEPPSSATISSFVGHFIPTSEEDMNQPTRQSISPARRDLLDRCHEAQFGQLLNLIVEDVEPRFGPNTRLVRTVTFNGIDNPSRKPGTDDFELKRPWVEL